MASGTGDRYLRAGNFPETTRYNYLLASAQLAATWTSTHRTNTGARLSEVGRLNLEDGMDERASDRRACAALAGQAPNVL